MTIGGLHADGSGEARSLADPPAGEEHGHDSYGHDTQLVERSDDAPLILSPADWVGDIPSIEMIDVSTGATVNLSSLVDNTTPMLLWFWATH